MNSLRQSIPSLFKLSKYKHKYTKVSTKDIPEEEDSEKKKKENDKNKKNKKSKKEKTKEEEEIAEWHRNIFLL